LLAVRNLKEDFVVCDLTDYIFGILPFISADLWSCAIHNQVQNTWGSNTAG